MRFAQMSYAYGFWLILMLILFSVWAFKRKKHITEKFAKKTLLNELTHSVHYKKQVIKSILIISALVLSLLALMRPQWGFKWQEVKRQGLDILIALDTSKSMLASDIKPNRLERSKLALKDLVKRLEGDRIGLIAFSGTAFLQCPLTVDYNGFLLALNDVNANTIPRGGTSISNAIKQAIKSHESGAKKYKALIIITDGEDHEGDAIKLAKEASKANIRIFCIGIGTTAGELIQVVNEEGKKSFLKDKSGNIIKSRLNENILMRIALEAKGMYVRSSGADFGLDLIYDKKLSKMEKRNIKTQMTKHYNERFQIPLALALLLLIIELFVTDRKKL